jgi:uncharacterized protein YqeY
VTLRERIQTEITAAMRSGDSLRRDTLRMAENAIYNAEKRERRTYGDDEVTGILTREVKTRRESIEAFRKGGRDDLAEKEASEIAILTAFLPEQLSEDDLRGLVEEAVTATGSTSRGELGKVMGYLSPKTKGRADGRRVAELVTARLGGGLSSGAAGEAPLLKAPAADTPDSDMSASDARDSNSAAAAAQARELR